MKKTVAIIGGGAAGLMAAASICQTAPGTEVHLFEKNTHLGAKVLISGGGRCNVTTGIHDLKEVLTRYPRGARFLRTAMYAFPPDAVYAWFESQGTPLKVEADMRVFPRSNQGADVVGAFEKLFARHSGMHVHLRSSVATIQKNGQFIITLKEGKTFRADAVIITTGGQAFRRTGSTGDGYTFAEEFGHSITPLAASLSSFLLAEEWPKHLAGVSFQKAVLSVTQPTKFSYPAPVLLTHKGTSGPAVFAVSAHVAFEKISREHPLSLFLDVLPGYTLEELTGYFLSAKQTDQKKHVLTMLTSLVPRSFAECVLRELEVAGDTFMVGTSDKSLRKIAQFVKHVPLHIIGRSAGDEFVTAGGVSTSEVDPKTMESKKIPGLYFAGEVLDVDGYTGGFNLQASWATGRLAGLSVS